MGKWVAGVASAVIVGVAVWWLTSPDGPLDTIFPKPIPRLIYDAPAQGGEILRGGEVDRWRFEASTGEYARVYVICANKEVIENHIRCPDNGLKSASLALYGPNEARIQHDPLVFGEGGQATLNVQSLPSTGTYTVEVRGAGGQTGRYSLMLTHELNID